MIESLAAPAAMDMKNPGSFGWPGFFVLNVPVRKSSACRDRAPPLSDRQIAAAEKAL